MSNAIIGHTGFVGGNLVRQASFDDFYNSKDIEKIAGNQYDLLVCSGAPAEKWKANKEPVKDRESIDRLIGCLRKTSARKLILISTVDVYPIPVGVDEETAIGLDSGSAYGKHRRALEKFVEDHFDSLIIRLPGLFGKGIKKNIIYDFLRHNNVDQIHADNHFQFYSLEHLWGDIEQVLKHPVHLINFATEPVSVEEVAREGFGISFNNRPKNPPVRYDFRTKYASLFGRPGGYLYTKEEIFTSLKRFVSEETQE
jgi:nucleoside-diphosphate-sugar epimerase